MNQPQSYIQKEILRLLQEHKASYAHPMNSAELSRQLNVTPSYIREQAKQLFSLGLLDVRRGPGGGYFIA
ncbi:MAG: Rrf2 family transcriptional regulator [Clostridia bacterium]|nr:Rrf2 family transcriptional regulator [Clostridia bacterium]